MQETQCDKFGVSGGLGEPRFGLKLWLGSADLRDDNSSKSWVLFRDLPYLAIVMGVDLCMFMSVGSHTTNNKKPSGGTSRWRVAAAGASVPQILKGDVRGGDEKGATWRTSENPPSGRRRAPGLLRARLPRVRGRRQLRSFCYPEAVGDVQNPRTFSFRLSPCLCDVGVQRRGRMAQVGAAAPGAPEWSPRRRPTRRPGGGALLQVARPRRAHGCGSVSAREDTRQKEKGDQHASTGSRRSAHGIGAAPPFWWKGWGAWKEGGMSERVVTYDLTVDGV